jgi:hypothetical protein
MRNRAQNLVCARREFLNGAVRYALLGGIIAATATALINGGRSGRSCRRQFLCGGCPLADKCSLPEAAKFRNRPGEVKI